VDASYVATSYRTLKHMITRLPTPRLKIVRENIGPDAVFTVFGGARETIPGTSGHVSRTRSQHVMHSAAL
jgi:hypothetical protein